MDGSSELQRTPLPQGRGHPAFLAFLRHPVTRQRMFICVTPSLHAQLEFLSPPSPRPTAAHNSHRKGSSTIGTMQHHPLWGPLDFWKSPVLSLAQESEAVCVTLCRELRNESVAGLCSIPFTPIELAACRDGSRCQGHERVTGKVRGLPRGLRGEHT